MGPDGGTDLKELPDQYHLMSAYSDKEYLKAAIKLKALGYVENPLTWRNWPQP